jgi:hypothetical protein
LQEINFDVVLTLAIRMEEKTKEFTEKGSEIYQGNLPEGVNHDHYFVKLKETEKRRENIKALVPFQFSLKFVNLSFLNL